MFEVGDRVRWSRMVADAFKWERDEWFEVTDVGAGPWGGGMVKVSGSARDGLFTEATWFEKVEDKFSVGDKVSWGGKEYTVGQVNGDGTVCLASTTYRVAEDQLKPVEKDPVKRAVLAAWESGHPVPERVDLPAGVPHMQRTASGNIVFRFEGNEGTTPARKMVGEYRTFEPLKKAVPEDGRMVEFTMVDGRTYVGVLRGNHAQATGAGLTYGTTDVFRKEIERGSVGWRYVS